jgi:thioredoxin reductase/Pyruvate/2-oxoacid:ferredoxin oxidoreductase delta subunit
MSWPLLFALVFGLGFALLAVLARKASLARMRGVVHARDKAVRQGSAKALLQVPVVDLSRCLGCGTCVAVCPEEGVLDLVHGQAAVINGARCVGHAICERECPVAAITVTIADLEERRDVPALTEGLEAVGSPGLFLAGEVTAHALIKTAIDHGVAVAQEVARRVAEQPAPVGAGTWGGPGGGDVLDLVVVGAGPAGLACSLEAKRQGLRFVTIDQENGPGGTVAKYPRRKLVMMQPVDLPLRGRLAATTYSKEELVDLWNGIAAEEQLPIAYGHVLEGVERDAEGSYVVHTGRGDYLATHVCLAVGRRGSPRKLGVPGEDLPKVAYGLLDASSYLGRRILVVGGGDSAVEAAMALAEQPGNEVTISYRKEAFFRLRARNDERLSECREKGQLQVVFQSEVRAIRPQSVELVVRDGAKAKVRTLPNDEVFILAGGVPPVELLEKSGVSLDPAHRAPAAPVTEQGTGAFGALAVAFLLSLCALAWALWNADYYGLKPAERAAHWKHAYLHPARGVGLWLGIAAVALIAVNLLYLVRRSTRFRWTFGSLQGWMSVHVATGILALLCAMMHGAMRPGDSPGGHAFWGLAVLLVTGAIGRYFYAYVPRAANGRELELVEVKARLGRVEAEWGEGERRFRERARHEVDALIEARQWRASFVGRVLALFRGQKDLREVLARLEGEGRGEGVPAEQIAETLDLARRAHRTSLMAAHYEDLRAILGTWRYLHRWIALLTVLLVLLHIVHAFLYGALFLDGGIR